MQRKELDILYKTISGIYSDYQYDDRLLKYDYKDVKKRFQLHKGPETPTFEYLTKDLNEENDPGAYMKCEYCGKIELVFNTDDWIKAHRKCQKIDFIDRQCKQIHGQGITKEKYYSMSDEELEKNYRQYMNHYLAHRDDTPILKTI